MQEKRAGRAVWRFFRVPLIVVVAIAIGAAISFLIAGTFSVDAYADRVFWGGIGAILVGGFAVVASLGAYSTLGTPNVLTAGSDARIAHERVGEYLRTNAGRYMFSIRMLMAGLACIALSALIGTLAG